MAFSRIELAPSPEPLAAEREDMHPLSAQAASAAVLAAGLVSACGGGGGDSGGVSAAPPPGAAAPPPGPAQAPAPAPIGDAEAARFLAQAGFAASTADIATVKASGYAGWLDQQFAMPAGLSNYDWMVAQSYAVAANVSNFNGVDSALWRQWLSAPDQTRQRVTLALSEIFVISMLGVGGNFRGPVVAAYVDMLSANAFGTYRGLLEDVALSVGMGLYLNMLGSKKAGSSHGSVPDENFPREVMQLMSIGLVQLNLDGTPVLDASGNPQPTYDQTDVTNLAAVFTGWTYDGVNATDPGFAKNPMVNVAANFSTGPTKVLDVDVPSTADGPGAMKIALDTLASHPNVGPFIGRQLIQRLVRSNPSAAYVQRVATAFNDNGSGQRGDMKAVIKAVLLDTEARALGSDPAAGRLREPMLRFIQWGRTFGVSSPTSLWNVGDTSNAATRLGQSPLRSPSVFNFFRPGYVPPNSVLGTNNITAPEFQLCNETTTAGYLNFMQTVIGSGIGEVKADYTAQLALASDASALVANIALLIAASSLSDATLTTISSAVGKIAADTDAGKLNRVQAAVLLVMASPEYQVQK